jgi:hypothetical protein
MLNLVLGIGLSLLLLALWIRWGSRPTPLRVGLLAVGATGLYVVHLFPLGALGLAVLALTAVERPPWRTALARLAPFVPPAVLFLWYRAAEGLPHGLHAGYDGLWLEKLRLFANVLVQFDWAEGLVVTGSLVAAFLAARRGGPGRPEPRARALLVTFAVAYAVFPKKILGVYYADERLLVYLALAVVLSWPVPAGRRRFAVAAATAVTVLAVALSTARLARYDREVAGELTVLSAMEPGRRVLPVDHRPFVGRVDLWHHVACWYTVRRGGTTAYQFAKPGEHVLRWRRRLAAPHEFFSREPGHEPPDLEAIVRDFDYLWKFGAGPPADDRLRRVGRPVAVRPDAAVWKLEPREDGSGDGDG